MTKFSVPGMSCAHCTSSIESSVLDADEGAQLTFDLEKKTVEIDSVLEVGAQLQAIKSAGFDATAL